MYCEHCEIELAAWETRYQMFEADIEAGYAPGFLTHDYCPDCGTEMYC